MPKQFNMFGPAEPITQAQKGLQDRVAALLRETPSLANNDWDLVVAYWRKYARFDEFMGGGEVVRQFQEFVNQPDVPTYATIVRRRRELRNQHRASQPVESYRLRRGHHT